MAGLPISERKEVMSMLVYLALTKRLVFLIRILRSGSLEFVFRLSRPKD